ncbi:uncharacterized protein LOC130374816 isoform X3 [Gadus chalcogrammus]|uniref:uncharacterized protein LOC130374816 isoform X3 n=1 Tax=Gadus chalcogrammus TaxID=1042646 RepID=UPI0024C4CBAA|nr:uncharacterized protein LOC130374816 isoform X3 [Gadus chalcogrammus]
MVASPSYKDYGRTEFRAGDCVSLSCGAQSDCSIITWLFSYNNGTTVELVVGGKVKSEDKKERLHVTKECSLEVKKMRKEDEGHYTCREYPSPRRQVDHALHEVKLMTSTNRPTPTTVKANTSTSKPTTTPVKGAASSSPAARPSTSTPTTHTLNGAASSSPTSWPPSTPTPHTPNAPTAGVLLRVLVLLGFSVLTLVVLLRLIGWWRTRGNRAATEECIGLNSSSDAPPARERLGPGASDQQQHTVEMDLDWAPRGPSVVQRGGQRAVGSAQDQVDPGELSDAANYENLRAPPRCAGDTADTGVHFVTVHQLSK